MVLPFRETWFSWCWWFSLYNFGIAFRRVWASIWDLFWTPLASKSMFQGSFFFFDDSVDRNFSILEKTTPTLREHGPPFSKLFRHLFPHTCTYYIGKTYKCQKQPFPTFCKKEKEVLRSCIFYFGKTDKCAVTVFTVLTNKTHRRKLIPTWPGAEPSLREPSSAPSPKAPRACLPCDAVPCHFFSRLPS